MKWQPLAACVAAAFVADCIRRTKRPFRPPCGAHRIIRRYGGVSARRSYGSDGALLTSDDRFHSGIDFELLCGRNVYAARAGRVIAIEDWQPPTRARGASGYGRRIDIEHLDGLISRYAHLGNFAVEIGSEVSCGQIIGHSGATGHVKNRPRLHFELRDHSGKTFDPFPLIRW